MDSLVWITSHQVELYCIESYRVELLHIVLQLLQYHLKPEYLLMFYNIT